MAKKKKTPEELQKEAKLKLKKFNIELEELLAKYGYLMDVRIQITSKGIVPRLVVDTPENMSGQRVQGAKPPPSQIAQMIKEGKINKDNVSEKRQEEGKKPSKKGKKD